MKIRIASFMLALALMAGASVASAQAINAQNPWAYTPMAFFWGNQTTPTTSTTGTINTQIVSNSADSAIENLWAFMPMFRFFSFSR